MGVRYHLRVVESCVSLRIIKKSGNYVFLNVGSGRKGAETPPSCPSTPGSLHGKILLQPGQARAPMFITVSFLAHFLILNTFQ